MTKNLKCFSLLFVFMFSMVSAESKEGQYRLYVTEVDPEFHCFSLSNHMVFNIPKRLWETTALPEVGTEVYIKPWLRIVERRPSYNEGDFLIVSQDSMKEPITAWMTKDSEQYCLSCVSSESVCIQPAGWTTPGVYQNVLTLSDGSNWMLDAKVGFTPGNRIVISKIKEEDDYMIIDIDRFNVITLGNVYISYEDAKAKPYVPVEIAQE